MKIGWVSGKARITLVWAIRSWSFGLGFPSNVWVVVFIGPLVVWFEPVERIEAAVYFRTTNPPEGA